jgi:hypothetical protein
MTEQLSSEIFSQHVKSNFLLSVPGGSSLSLELLEVEEKNYSPDLEQFSLLFRGPRTPKLGQSLYTLEHEKLGKLELFLVPVGPDSVGMGYQAVFNRMRKQVD